MYVHLMGHSTTPLHIHAVKLAQSPTLLHRYETVCQIFRVELQIRWVYCVQYSLGSKGCTDLANLS
jgi:hypothetical protein